MSGTRLTQVFRTWERLIGSRSFASRRAWWDALDGESMGLGLACLALAVSAPMEAALWGFDWDPIGLRRVEGLPGSVIAGVLTGIWLANAWCFDGLIRVRLGDSGRPRAGLRAVRSLIVGFPGLGITSIPLWQLLAEWGPSWAYGSPSPSRRTRARKREARFLLPAPEGPAVFFLWLAGIASLLLTAVWLAAPQNPGAGRRAVLVAGSSALHGLGLLGTLGYTRTLDRRGSSRGHYLWAGGWLLPLPLTLVAFAPLGFDLRGLRQETLTWTAYARRGQAGGLVRWSQMERSLRRAWITSPWWRRWGRPMGRRRKQVLATVDRDLLGVCRVKIALLVGDGVLVGWLLHQGGVDLGRPPWIGCVALVVAGGALAGALAVLVRNLLATVRLAPEPAPLGAHRQIWYATVAVVTLGFGLIMGSTLAAGHHRETGLLLIYGAALAQMAVGFGFILQTPLAPWSAEGAGAGLRWAGVLFALMATGGCVAALPVAAAAFLVAALAMPLWHGLFFVSARRLFDRCFEPGGARAGTRGPPAGRERTQVLVAALLPLGGVAVPSWLRLRERLLQLGTHE